MMTLISSGGAVAKRSPAAATMRNLPAYDPFLGHTAAGLVLTEHIGGGGMSLVYAATRPGSAEKLAVKVAWAGTVEHDAASLSLEREALALDSLMYGGMKPRGIVTFHDFIEVDDHPAIVLGFIEGKPLSAYAGSGRRFRLPAVLAILGAVSDALAVVHEKKLVHNDINPENIMLAQEDGILSLKLVDFGLARFLTDARYCPAIMPQAALGKLPYMDRRTLLGGPAEFTTDLHALGVMGYALLNGCFPFDGGSAGEMIRELDSGPLPFPVSVPISVARLVTSLFNGEHRFSDAVSLAAAIRAL